MKLTSLSKEDDASLIDELPSDDEWVVDENENVEELQRPNDEDLGVNVEGLGLTLNQNNILILLYIFRCY